ncbi:hypothetical protein [Victivallis vadensis]|uniref:hypothetical protein n=1 Tax=Victivallis vadensis TaxID=172901 RepID=UPI0010579E93|nr:hypothetical protein [Victivallis vadensis]HJH02497.1 hypothetical protein [Victivallis vadensis]
MDQPVSFKHLTKQHFQKSSICPAAPASEAGVNPQRTAGKRRTGLCPDIGEGTESIPAEKILKKPVFSHGMAGKTTKNP